MKLEDIVLTEGLPCHKFILQALTSLNDAKTFTKNYVTTMVKYGMSHEDIATSLLFLSARAGQLNGIYRFEQWENHTEGFDLVDDILMDNTVALYKNCRQYYKLFDAKYTACSLCPMAQVYKNKWIENERQVIRYCLESRSNLEYITGRGITPDSFAAVIDVTARKTAAGKPCLYPFFKRTFEALVSGPCAGDIFDENMGYDIVLEQYHSTKLEKMPSILRDCSVSLTTFCTVMISEQLPEQACSKEEVDRYLNPLLADITEKAPLSSLFDMQEANGIRLSKHCNLGREQLAGFYKAENDGKDKKPQKKSGKSNKPVSLSEESTFVEISLFDIMTGLNNGDYDDNTSDEKDANDTISGIDIDDATETGEQSPAKNSTAPTLFLPVLYQGGSLSATYPTDWASPEDEPQIHVQEISRNNDEYSIEKDSLVAIPTVSKRELAHFSLDLDAGNSMLLTLFESYILKDGRLAVELVYVEKDYYLLFYSPKMHAYFHSACTRTDVKEIISMLLSYSSVEKYCYSPYVLSSVTRQLNMRIKNLWSIYSMSAVLYKNHRMPMDAVLCEMGAIKAEGGITVQAEGDIQSDALAYMHCYHNVFHYQKRKLTRMGLFHEYEEQNAFDIVLGLSYYQSLYCKTPACLFQLKGAGNYVFHSIVPSDYHMPGKTFSLYFRHSPTQSSHVIIWLLREMYQRGMFDNCEIMIQSLGENFITFFARNEDVEYVDLRINRMLLKHLKENGLRGMEYCETEVKDGKVCSVSST